MKLEELDWKSVALGIAAPSSFIEFKDTSLEEMNLLSELGRRTFVSFSISSCICSFKFLKTN